MSAAGVVADLIARVERLEQQARQPSGEQLSANYLTATPAGQIGANFTGVINALGLIIPAATSSTPGAQNQIVWERADGGVVASIYAGEVGPQDQLVLSAQAADAGHYGFTLLQAIDSSGNPTFVQALSAGGGQTAAVRATADAGAGAAQVTVIDVNGRSSFARIDTRTGTAAAGGAALPASPQGFIVATDTFGTVLKLPYYN